MIIVRLVGGLGNQMFQYALGRHLSIKHRTELLIDKSYFDFIPINNNHFIKREYELFIFNIEENIMDSLKYKWLPCYSKSYPQRIKNRIKRSFNLYKYLDNYELLYERNNFNYDNDILNCSENAYLVGYWQNEKYFKHIEKQIRKDFSFRDIFDENTYKLANEISKKNSICLHVRRGDFIENQSHGFVGLDYIKKAFDIINKKTDIQLIYIFSDEINWCKENIHFDVPLFFVDQLSNLSNIKNSFSDLFLMTQCKHFIISNSTFGWWAAWLSNNNEKIVVAPKRWMNSSICDGSGIIPDGWIII